MSSESDSSYDISGKRVYVAGHRGMVGSALVRRLATENCEILTATRADADLCRQEQVEAWMADHKPHAVIIAAAKVGGILANDSQPADFIYENLVIEANLIHASWQVGVEKLLFLGSSCIYPKFAPQPIPEDSLLTGELEPTNQWYAVAKIAGIKLCQAYRRQYGSDFISAMPTNLYGDNDNFDLKTSHVLPALIAKAHLAKLSGATHLDVWGTGKPRREFLHVDDAADASVHLLVRYSGSEHVNVGVGDDISIADVARLVCDVVGFAGDLRFQTDKPDGTPVKRLDVSRLNALGWKARIELADGIARTYRWFLDHHAPEPATTG